MKRPFSAALFFLLFSISAPAHASTVVFTSRELFRIAFGNDKNLLGAKIDGDNMLIPQNFTMDGAGHIFIYDAVKHRVARYSGTGVYEMSFRYPETANQVFAHTDAHQNLWLLISDPLRGLDYGVYDTSGKRLREGIFAQFKKFQLHIDDDGLVKVLVSPENNPTLTETYFFDEKSLLMKKDPAAAPPENHHSVRRSDRVFYVDGVPGTVNANAPPVSRITDQSHHGIADIKGAVVFIADNGDIYTRVGKREIDVYDVDGSLLGRVKLTGLSSACASIRFDSEGNIYQLDGIPNPEASPLKPNEDPQDRFYSGAMPGMRFVLWQRQTLRN